MAPSRRTPPPLDAQRLRRITAHYLARYGTSRAHLRRLLLRRARRAAEHHGQPLDALRELIEAELDRLEALGWLDDRAYARDRARALHRRGLGPRAIRARLAAKGLDPDRIDEALAALAEEVGELEWSAARTWARKRRLGPWSRAPLTDEERRRQLARLGRAGFSLAVARRVLALEAPEPP